MLSIANQGSLAEESITRDGIHDTVFVVVKNSPFLIHLNVANTNCGFDPQNSNMIIECKLYYDTQPPKVVLFTFLFYFYTSFPPLSLFILTHAYSYSISSSFSFYFICRK
jgi:hypothetical protein